MTRLQPPRVARLVAFGAACLLGQAIASAQDVVQTILPAPGSLHTWFGYTLAVDGSTLIAGDNQYRETTGSCSGSGYGAVDVYKKSGSTWSLDQTFLHTPGTLESMFGKRISFRGNVFVASAEREPYVNGGTTLSRAGAFFVYKRTSATAPFVQLAKIYAPVPREGQEFTFLGGLATNGTYIAAFGSPTAPPFEVYIYQITTAGVNQVATITLPLVTGNRLFITDQNVLVVAPFGGVSGPLAYSLNGSQVTQIDTSSLNHTFYNTTAHMAGDGNTVVVLKRFLTTGAYRPQFVKFTATGIEWSEFLMLPMSYDGLDEVSGPGSHPSGLALEENQGFFITYPHDSEAFVLGYRYSGSRYRPAGVIRTGVNHTFPISNQFAQAVAYNGTDLFINDTSYVTTPGAPIFCTNPGTYGFIKVMQPVATNTSGPEGSTKLQPWLTSTVSEMGTAVATDGTYVVAGSAWDQDARGSWGEMTLFQNLGNGQWRHVERYVDGWTGWEMNSGWSGFAASVAINDNFLVIGAPQAESTWSEVRSGAVYIARKVNGVFEAGPVLTNEGALPGIPIGTYFGNAVALSGTTLAIGAPDWENPPSRGSVWIYNYNASTNDWISNEQLAPNQASGQDWEAFGYAVAASGDNLIVGIPYRSSNGRTYDGAIQIFRRNPTTGFYTSMLEANAPTSWPSFSYLGGTVSIGADWAAASGGTGSVVIYRRNTTTGNWSQNTVITPSPAVNGFGYSVAIEGTQLVVGSPYENKVYAYTRQFGAWNQTGTITGTSTSGGFGHSVAFKNGNVAIGDYGALSGTSNFNTGAVYFISFNGI